MFSTVEVRWFHQGEIPVDIQTWFSQIAGKKAEPITQSPRTDIYLLQNGNANLGVKLREGRIEIKQRTQEFGNATFASNVVGVVEGWRKWSYLVDPTQTNYLSARFLGASWQRVSKERSLYSFQISGQNTETVKMPDYSIGGCNIELTHIKCNGEVWWSLGLEAFGDENSNESKLTIAAKYLFSEEQTPTLSAQNSYGYPHWLELVKPC